MARASDNTSTKKVFFYKAITERDERGRPTRLNLGPAFAHINALPFTPEGRYWDDENGNGVTCVIDSPTHIRLGVIRRSNLPMLEQGGALGPLGIPRDAGLFEATHIVLFPSNVVGAEFNFYGPRVHRLPKYLNEKCRGRFPAFTFATLARPDIEQRLEQYADVRQIDLKVTVSAAQQIAEASPNLAKSLKLAAQETGAKSIEYVLKPEPRSGEHLADRMRAVLRKIVRRPEFREDFEKLKITGFSHETNRVEPLDLLRDDLIVTREVLRVDERSRAVRPESMYRAIEESYIELKPLLDQAAELEM